MSEGRLCCDAVLNQQAHLRFSSSSTTHHLVLDPVPVSAGVARSFIRTTFASVDEESEDAALLLTSELVTNAILHARTPVQLGVMLGDDRALVCVADRLAEARALAPLGKSDDRFGGRGLALVADLSEEWGVTGYTGGKTVWFVLGTTFRERRRAG